MFIDYNLQEFISQFNTPDKCKNYLFDLKWQEEGFYNRCSEAERENSQGVHPIKLKTQAARIKTLF